MKNLFRAAAASVAIVVLAPASSALAGPLEDGVKAYSKADYKTAQRLLMPLAEQGNVDAQYSVGMMYEKGQGVDADKVQAHMWFDLASREGDKDSAADRDALESEMTPDQIAAAKQAAAQWKPKQ